jgi:AcrR family transcriptional regulator
MPPTPKTGRLDPLKQKAIEQQPVGQKPQKSNTQKPMRSGAVRTARSGSSQPRLNQQQRADNTIDLLVRSATRLFGERGYANTSLEDIALDCNLTIGAIYHHFGNKKALFAAANEAAERRIIDTIEEVPDAGTGDGDVLQLFQRRWQALLNLCNESGFRQIVLIDSPNVLGRDRWVSSEVTRNMQSLAALTAQRSIELELTLRIMRGAAAEAILALAESGNAEATRRVVDSIINRLLTTIAESFAADSR